VKGLISFRNPELFTRAISILTFGSAIIIGAMFFNGIMSFQTAVILSFVSLMVYNVLNSSFQFRLTVDFTHYLEELILTGEVTDNDGKPRKKRKPKVKSISVENPEDLEAALKEIQESILNDMANHKEEDKED